MPPPSAELIVVGKVLTGRGDPAPAGAVAIGEGRVLARGGVG